MSASKSYREAIFFIIILTLSIYRFSYLGFRYTPYLDDYIQYYFYPSFDSPWQKILFGGTGVLFTRPLAGLFDFFLWSNFKNCLWLPLIIISLFHGLSGVFFCKAFRCIGLKLGATFLVFYLFLPINIEGTYWLSASTRIVVSQFLISVSLMAAVNRKTFLFAVFNFLSLWFYEQTAILALISGITFCLFTKQPRKIFIPVLNFIFLAAFYLLFASLGDNAHRLTPISSEAFLPNAAKVLLTFTNILGPVSWKLVTNGLARSMYRILNDYALLWLGILELISMAFIAFSETENKQFSKTKLIYGSILAIAPLIPFFITSSTNISLRNIVPCLLGIAVIFDALLPFLCKGLTSLTLSFCLIAFSIVSVSEVCDYEKTALHDLALAKKISAYISKDTTEVSVKLTSPVYLPQNAVYGDHIKSMVGSDWGIMGIVRTVSGNKKVIVKIRN